jgi:hypothetical protein
VFTRLRDSGRSVRGGSVPVARKSQLAAGDFTQPVNSSDQPIGAASVGQRCGTREQGNCRVLEHPVIQPGRGTNWCPDKQME